jgi:calcium/calmodulin-dependent protein kinase I
MTSQSDDASVKLADFGFAKKASGFSLRTQCGSPGYVAPEILENKPYGKTFDVK